jgi:hypothetical protein
MCLDDLGQDSSHSLVAGLKIVNRLFDGRNKRLLPISCHLRMHAIALSAADEQL